jgi:hypothetical protein
MAGFEIFAGDCLKTQAKQNGIITGSNRRSSNSSPGAHRNSCSYPGVSTSGQIKKRRQWAAGKNRRGVSRQSKTPGIYAPRIAGNIDSGDGVQQLAL